MGPKPTQCGIDAYAELEIKSGKGPTRQNVMSRFRFEDIKQFTNRKALQVSLLGVKKSKEKVKNGQFVLKLTAYMSVRDLSLVSSMFVYDFARKKERIKVFWIFLCLARSWYKKN